ncbi:uncharacterized protein LOC132760268 [Ruditapes philippinarum]|uniref:uncharacterized protein LOC132760268 n=1 Tax=Ruditapes philippinarum TaxID=129788 RepID=UPI00295B0CEC|nr:uncharacterized protein LOC132760268 [Ruditapes philippinarum]
MSTPFPIIDLSKIGLQKKCSEIDRQALETVADQLKNSLCKFGACYCTNHGIEYEDKYVKRFEKFYKQPLDVKTQHLRGTRRDFGYSPIGQEKINLERPGDLKECFNYQPADDPNDWKNNDFPSACREMFNDCEILGYRMLDALSIALGQNQTFLREGHRKIGTRENPTTFRTLYYPPVTTTNLEPSRIRFGEHSDYGTISFVFQDDVGGLEINVKDQGFVQAIPIPGTLLLIAADLLQRWTEDKVPAVVHRVLIPEDEHMKTKPRQSAVFFILPDHDFVVSPMYGSTKYKPITCLEYLQPKMEALADVKY